MKDELQTLISLIDDFGTPEVKKEDPKSLLQKISIRFQELQKKYFEIYPVKLDPGEIFLFIKHAHQQLFKGILLNAGEFRKVDDPGGGIIYFGPYNQRTGQSTSFTGLDAHLLENEIIKLSTNLVENDDLDLSQKIMSFYQQFVWFHPFYDGNGRVARLVISHYARQFNYAILWQSLYQNEQKATFIKKLNHCHKAIQKNQRDIFKKQLSKLSQFFDPFLIHIPPNLP